MQSASYSFGVLSAMCITLIAETRLALRSVKSEMEFTLMLRAKYQERRDRMLRAEEKEI